MLIISMILFLGGPLFSTNYSMIHPNSDGPCLCVFLAVFSCWADVGFRVLSPFDSLLFLCG